MNGDPEFTTPDSLSEHYVARYREQGFVHVPRVLAREEVDYLLAEALRRFDQDSMMAWDLGGGAVAFDWVPDANRKSEVLNALATHPGITRIAERLAGGALRLFKSELLRKLGGIRTAITPPHDDKKTFPFTSTPAPLTAWVALVDVPVERGCLTFLPGSHTRSERTSSTADPDVYPLAHWPELARLPRESVPVMAGDVTFHHERTVHMAGVNRTETTRVALATVYMGADATYRPSSFYAGLYPDDPDLGGMRTGESLKGERFPHVATFRH